MVRRLAVTGGLTVLLVSLFAEAHVWPRRQGHVGWASWYGAYHHGRQTASGERFSMHALTAAHRSLPLETTVLVTNLDPGQQVQVTINDRGPFVAPQRRIIDLSRPAGVERTPNTSQPVPSERRETEPLAADLAGTSVARPRRPSPAGPLAPSSVSWPDCRVAEAQCLAGD